VNLNSLFNFTGLFDLSIHDCNLCFDLLFGHQEIDMLAMALKYDKVQYSVIITLGKLNYLY